MKGDEDIFGNDDVVSAVPHGEEEEEREGYDDAAAVVFGNDDEPPAGEQFRLFEGYAFGSWSGPRRSEGESSSGSAAATAGSESHKRPKVYADFE